MDKEDINKQIEDLERQFSKVYLSYNILMIVLQILFDFILKAFSVGILLIPIWGNGALIINLAYYSKRSELKGKLNQKNKNNG